MKATTGTAEKAEAYPGRGAGGFAMGRVVVVTLFLVTAGTSVFQRYDAARKVDPRFRKG